MCVQDEIKKRRQQRQFLEPRRVRKMTYYCLPGWIPSLLNFCWVEFGVMPSERDKMLPSSGTEKSLDLADFCTWQDMAAAILPQVSMVMNVSARLWRPFWGRSSRTNVRLLLLLHKIRKERCVQCMKHKAHPFYILFLFSNRNRKGTLIYLFSP